MKQMVAPEAPVAARLQFGTIAAGFFRHGRDGKVYFAMEYGRETFNFPVLVDGRISRHTGTGIDVIYPTKVVEVIRAPDLGIKAFDWADEHADDSTPSD